jgi:hypothetical protein
MYVRFEAVTATYKKMCLLGFRAVWCKFTDVSNVLSASIIKAIKQFDS